jgi:hypothetical protein
MLGEDKTAPVEDGITGSCNMLAVIIGMMKS